MNIMFLLLELMIHLSLESIYNILNAFISFLFCKNKLHAYCFHCYNVTINNLFYKIKHVK